VPAIQGRSVETRSISNLDGSSWATNATYGKYKNNKRAEKVIKNLNVLNNKTHINQKLKIK